MCGPRIAALNGFCPLTLIVLADHRPTLEAGLTITIKNGDAMPRFTLSPRGLLACLITACLAQSVVAAEGPAAASPQTTASNAAVLQQLSLIHI